MNAVSSRLFAFQGRLLTMEGKQRISDTPTRSPVQADVYTSANADTYAHHTCAQGLFPPSKWWFEAEAAESWAEAAGGGPAGLWPLAQKCGEPLKLPQLRWKPLRAALRGSHSFSNKEEKFLRTLVFPLKQTSETLFSRGSSTSCSPSPRGWEVREWAA